MWQAKSHHLCACSAARFSSIRKPQKTANGLYDGNKATGAPDYTVTFGAEWDTNFLPNLTLSARMISTGSSYVDAANTQKMAGWNTFDFGARYTRERENAEPVVVRANLTNAFNEAYWSTFPAQTCSTRVLHAP
ncbi:TonB-dependent receptor [Ochrobactrum cytisi]|nr:TonB-dependent receptor [Brucella cytisi]